jgi:FAS-associated factor 2
LVFVASLKLGATTYPFVAFVSLHPVPTHLGGPGTSHSGSGPRLTVLSRHEGSPTSNTSAQTLHTHITTSLLPRVTPLLTRLRTERWNRAQERALREEQDRAFQEAAAKDRERVLQKQEAERRTAAEAEARIASEQQRVALSEKRTQWRRYARKHLVPPEPVSGGLRIGIRLPDGKRAVRRFASEDDTTALYTFVETLLISPQDVEGDSDAAPSGYTHEWSFALVTSFPRHEIPSLSKVPLTSIDELKGGANLVVEMTGPVADLEQGDSDDDDGRD